MKANNISAEASHLRDTFFKAERDYVLFLLQDEQVKSLIEELNEYDSEELFRTAQNLVNAVEMGIIPEEKMEYVEKKLIVLLAAIKDITLRKELVLTPNYGCEQTHGKSR